MELNTIFKLSINYEEEIVEEGNIIKVKCRTGEVFIGVYIRSGLTDLIIERKYEEITIDFEDITEIEIVQS